MTIQPWLASAIVIGIGTLALFSYRYVLRLIRDNKDEYDKDILEAKVTSAKATDAISSELKELRNELHARIDNSEGKLTDAIKELMSAVVPRTHCDSRQEWWGAKFDNLVETMRVATDTRMKSDIVTHTAMGDTLREVVGGLKNLESKLNKK